MTSYKSNVSNKTLALGDMGDIRISQLPKVKHKISLSDVQKKMIFPCFVFKTDILRLPHS